MYKPFIKKQLLSLLLALPFLSVFSLAEAKGYDTKQEITIKSNRQAGDLKNKIISYLDNVSITQGTLSITADLVQVIKQADSDHDIYVAKGKPVTFQQELEDGSLVSLKGNEMTYEPAISTITIVGNAVLSQEGSEVRGNKIIYNTLTEQLEAESSQENPVTTILKPQTQGESK